MHSFRLCLLAAILVAAHVTSAFSRTWYIRPDGTGDAPTIQAGVDSAAAGDIVLVAAGTYSHMSSVLIDGTPTAVCVSITKNIRLLSEDGPTVTTIGNLAAGVVVYLEGVDGTTEVAGFEIRSEYVEFACVDVMATVQQFPYPVGIKCRDASPRIAGNHIDRHGDGVQLFGSPATIVGNTISRAFMGIVCKQMSNASITDNTVFLCGASVWSEESSLQIVGNVMSGGCDAVFAYLSAVTIRDNDIHSFDVHGIIGGSDFVIEDNRFFDMPSDCLYLSGRTQAALVRGNVFYDVFGVASLTSTHDNDIVIENNTIDGALSGIYCQASSPTIRANIIANSDIWISCWQGSSPTIACNDVFNVDVPYDGSCSDQTGINGNIAVDPQFCGVTDSGNYHLQGDSPCAVGNHPDGDDCGLIGAKGVACGTVPVKSMTWGQFKKLYDKKR